MRKTGTNKSCDNCGASFHVPAWRERRDEVKFCSMACLHEGRKPRQKKTRVAATCEECRESYEVPQYRVETTRFCSQRCAGSFRCRQEADQRAARRRQSSSPDLKVCSRCDEEKPLSEFYPHEKNRDGLRGECKSCVAEKHRVWCEENQERKAEMDRAYHEREAERINREAREAYAVNPEPIRAKNKKWRDDNQEKTKENSRRRRRMKPEVVRAERRQHYQDNKGRYVAQARAREEHVARATPPWVDRKAIEQFYVEAERLTHQTGIKHHVDHIYPLRGKDSCGLHVPRNLQVIPDIINLRKGNDVLRPIPAAEARYCAWPLAAMLEAA
jgi:hypothetical protein